MKQTKKRFQTEQEIIDAIDNCKTQSLHLQHRAEVLEEGIKDMLAEASETGGIDLNCEQINYDKRDAVRLRKRAASLIDVRLVKLKHKLAEFRTPQIPVLDNGDVSIPA